MIFHFDLDYEQHPDALDWRLFDKRSGEQVPFVRGFNTERGTVSVLPPDPGKPGCPLIVTDAYGLVREDTLRLPFRVVNTHTNQMVAETAE